jgi:[protein-PII] uridylyltransferase
MVKHLTTVEEHARVELAPARSGQLSPSERIALFRRFLKIEEHRIKLRHGAGAGGLEIARARAQLLDLILSAILETTTASSDFEEPDFALAATGGYGRATLNPGSDIDLLFLLPKPSNRLPKNTKELVESVLYLLWDVGFKVGHACRSIAECIAEAKADQENMTALMDARLISGDRALFEQFQTRFDRDCVSKTRTAFINLRREDLNTRHKKYSRTVFLQEPNPKESCGGLRDIHSMRWVARVKLGAAALQNLADDGLLDPMALREIREAEDFLHHVRNDLHYHTERATDILTLQLQGVVATNFRYPQRSILRRTEAFMRDYYRHTRAVYRHCLNLMEMLEIELAGTASGGIRSFLTRRRRKREEFDGFTSCDGLLDIIDPALLREDSGLLMRLFQHCQVRELRPSPDLRRLIKGHWELIDRPFRYSKANRQTFRAILERKGEVARILRLMHEVGFLGRYLPEFGALDCLVQHEFFHRYTADEHTLRCIDHLDALIDSDHPRHRNYRQLLHEIEDPYALYLALILHDTGRAENVREHIDGSALLASKLCNRLQIRGPRRSLITFLVDNHLSFWRYATSRNIEDPDVIAEFSRIVHTPQRLDALLLFTFADSSGTNPDAWSGWKETLMLQLHSSTHRYLNAGGKAYAAQLETDREELEQKVLSILGERYHERVENHFKAMPARYFRFREPDNVATHIRAVSQFLKREAKSDGGFECAIQWIDHPEAGYTELGVVALDRPQLLEKICCALASHQVNILSADLFTRDDGVVLDLFRICTVDFEPVSSRQTQLRVVDTLYEIGSEEEYDASRYLKRRKNFLKDPGGGGIQFPVRAYITNRIHPTCTVVEIQALDRIGLLHDLFQAVNSLGLTTTHARICTEKGAAMDSLYIVDSDGNKVTDEDRCEKLRERIEKIAATSDG